MRGRNVCLASLGAGPSRLCRIGRQSCVQLCGRFQHFLLSFSVVMQCFHRCGMSMHLCRSRFRSCNRRFLVLPSFTPKTMRSLSRLSCKQSQKLHVFRRFFSAATYVSVVLSKCCARVLNLYRSKVSLVCPKMWPSILPMMIAIVSVSAGRKRYRPVVLRHPSSK